MSATDTTAVLLDVLPRVADWTATADDLICSVTSEIDSAKHTEYYFSTSTVDQLHPQLADALYHITNFRYYTYSSVLNPGSLLVAQVNHLLSPLTIPAANKKSHRVSRILAVQPHLERVVPLEILGYTLRDAILDENTGAERQVAPYVKRTYAEQIYVHREWMDSTFPDWEKRYNVGVGLGYRDRELADYICTQSTPVLGTALPDLTFD